MELTLESELSREVALEKHDRTALTKDQQERLNQHKIVTRLENEHYLRAHPEVPVMMSAFLREVLLRRPQKIREFASEYFTDPKLSDKVKALDVKIHD